MKLIKLPLLSLFAASFLLSCINEANVSAQSSVESGKPSAAYSPAFEGQTRIKAVKSATPYTSTIINSKLDRPWAISVMPDGRFLITQKEGTMVILSANGALLKKINGLPKVEDAGQGGLLDVTLAPDFAKSRLVYWAYSEPQSKGVLLAIAKGKLAANETTIENQTIIYRATPA
ncbi:MAG: PQQ-dependent sugar dehydrogenase, partial [Pedobacter sp.]|nr:PQQ-dependent sugar dehydrogenase [Pedobacter sp.]